MPAAPKPALLFTLALSAALGCSPVVEYGTAEKPAVMVVDAGSAGQADAGQVDASQADAGDAAAPSPSADAGDAATDSGSTPDAATPDSGSVDAGTPDSGTQDAGTADSGVTPDAGTPDSGVTPDAGTPDSGSTPPPDAVPVALLGAHCSSGSTGLRLTLASAGTSCTEAAQLVRGDSPSESFVNAALNSSGSQTINTTGQYCDSSCRDLPVTIRITAHPSGGAATGSYSFKEGGSVIAEGDFSTSSCAYDTAGVSAKVVIDRVTISQAVDIPLYESGAVVSSRNAPIIADRAGQLRVFAHGQGGWSARQLTARLRITSGSSTRTLSDTLSVSTGTGNYSDPDSTFNFDLAASRIQESSAVRLELLESDGCPAVVSNEAGLGSFDLDAQEPLSMKVVLVPVTYLGTPITITAARTADYRAALLSHYPVSDAKLTVSASSTPIVWDGELEARPTGALKNTNWSKLLAAVQERRAADNCSDDTFYFALVDPPDSYCGSGCIAGIAPQNYDNWSPVRHAGIGLYERPPNIISPPEDTFVHEIGHTLGRPHAPCSVSDDVDPNYPYANGAIGTWGTEISGANSTLYPDTSPDFMGYCDDDWISDYTYRALYERLQLVHQRMSSSSVAFALPESWLQLVQDGSKLSFAGQIELREEPGGEPVAVSYLDADGVTVEEATAYRTMIADLPDSGSFFLPLAPEGAVAIQLDGYGQLAL